MATSLTYHERLLAANLLTRDPTNYPNLASETKVGDQIKVKNIPMEYQTPKEQLVFCYVCGRTNHNHGFVAETEQYGAILVGNCCARYIADQKSLNSARRVFETHKAKLHYDERIQALLPHMSEIVGCTLEYEAICRDLDDFKTDLIARFPTELRQLQKCAKENQGKLVTIGRKRNIQKDYQGQGPSFIYAEKSLGPLKGASFIASTVPLTPIQFSVRKASENIIESASAPPKNQNSSQQLYRDFQREVVDRSDRLEGMIDEGLKFIQSDNLKRIHRWLDNINYMETPLDDEFGFYSISSRLPGANAQAPRRRLKEIVAIAKPSVSKAA